MFLAIQTKLDKKAAYLILSHCSIGVVSPPHRITVVITMTRVVVRMRLRSSLLVFLIARANASAPRKPGKDIILWCFIFVFRLCKFYSVQIEGLRTREHHHMLEVVPDLVGTTQVEQEGQGVDVARSCYYHSNLVSLSFILIQHKCRRCMEVFIKVNQVIYSDTSCHCKGRFWDC